MPGRRVVHDDIGEALDAGRHIDVGAYDQRDAAGFIKRNAQRLRLLGRRNGR